ncbi:MAG: TonB-dependent receptor plug domain-containing protein, partial [Burkholderiales bacterium]|nr:TonB-dependent receptor plug domain-containing protein [Burkholderiales bacterium]
MPTHKHTAHKADSPLVNQQLNATVFCKSTTTMLPLGALLLAGSLGAMAQTSADSGKTLSTVTVKERAEAPEGKDSIRATETTIGKGRQQLRDIPQSVTVVTEKLMDDRNFDTMKDVLKTTGGISFMAAEGGEEDIRLRGFSLQATGDVFVDSMRDPAFYERDTFSFDRLEVLRGSASLLFGRGSTGGAVNMVNKVPRLIDEHQVDVTVGSHGYKRAVGDFNIKTGESAALRINAMATNADNNGAGSSIDKKGIAASYRHGIGERDEFSASIYHLDNQNGMNYGLPWVRPTATSPVGATTTLPLDPKAYYGMASDRNAGSATHLTLSHTHRFDRDNEIVTKVRKGAYERDQRAGTVRFGAAATQPDKTAVSLATFGPKTVITRGTQLKIQDLDNLYAQTDFSGKFDALGFKHEVQAGADFAREEKVVYGA